MTDREVAKKWAELLLAFAEGKTIQRTDCGHWYEMKSIQYLDLSSNVDTYRIKPELVTSVGYRRYVYKDNASNDYLVTVVLESVFEAAWEQSSDPEDWKFIEWIDEEWQYVKVEERK